MRESELNEVDLDALRILQEVLDEHEGEKVFLSYIQLSSDMSDEYRFSCLTPGNEYLGELTDCWLVPLAGGYQVDIVSYNVWSEDESYEREYVCQELYLYQAEDV